MTDRHHWDSASPAPAVLRAAAMLRAMAGAGGRSLGPAELAEAAGGIPRSSAVNVCAALAAAGLARGVDGGFTLGPGLVGLSQAYLDGLDPVRDFGAWTRSMTPIDETLQLGTLDGSDVVYLAVHAGRLPLSVTSRVGARIAATCTALGKAMLAGLPDERVRRLLDGAGTAAFPAYTPRSVTGVEELLAELAVTRQRGYAVDAEEAVEGITCVAVAVPGLPDGAQPFAVSTSMPTGRATEERVERLAGLLRGMR